MKVSWKLYDLKLDGKFTIAKGSFSSRRAMIIKLECEGLWGLGEITEISYYGIRLEAIVALLRKHQDRLSKFNLDTPQSFFQQISTLFPSQPFLCSALDCAAYDLYGKLNAQKTREYLELPTNVDLPDTSFTIGLDDPKSMQQKVLNRPWPIYKIKLGTPHDQAILTAISGVTSSTLRIDANEGWDESQASSMVSMMSSMNVDLIEQPLAGSNHEGMNRLRSKSSIPLIADESCQKVEDVARCHTHFDGINIKLMKCGGITPAIEMIHEARSRGMYVMIGCMTESSIGISAAAQLIPLVDFVDLDGSMLIKEDIAKGVSFKEGKPFYPNQYGLGCTLIQDDIVWAN